MAASGMLISSLLFCACNIMIAWLSLPWFIRFLIEHGVIAENYRGNRIPNGLGLYLWFLLLIHFALLKAWSNFLWTFPYSWSDPSAEVQLSNLHMYVIVLTIVFVVGWMDDSLGDKRIKGLKGHWGKWRRERIVTTGFLKAAVTIVLSLWVVFFELRVSGTLWIGLAQSFLIAFMTNAMNLLDLRPGRALKGFFLMSVFIFLTGSAALYAVFLFPLVIGAMLVLPKDLQAGAMLGDTGANFLGFALGFCVVTSTPLWFQITMLALLMGMHWFAERGSITKAIEGNRWLHWLDQLGRI